MTVLQMLFLGAVILIAASFAIGIFVALVELYIDVTRRE